MAIQSSTDRPARSRRNDSGRRREASRSENRMKSYVGEAPCVYVRVGDHEFCFVQRDVGGEEWELELGRFAVEYCRGSSAALVVHDAEMLLRRLPSLDDVVHDMAFDALDAGKTYARKP